MNNAPDRFRIADHPGLRPVSGKKMRLLIFSLDNICPAAIILLMFLMIKLFNKSQALKRMPAMKAPAVGGAFLVSQVGAHAANGFARRLSRLRLKPYDAGILRMLGSNPGLTQHALSEILGVFPSQLVALIDGLEGRRLIERRSTPEDRRRYHLYLTKEGRKTLAEIGRLTLQLEDDLFTALNKCELDLLCKLLRRIVAQQQITPGVHPAYKQVGRD